MSFRWLTLTFYYNILRLKRGKAPLKEHSLPKEDNLRPLWIFLFGILLLPIVAVAGEKDRNVLILLENDQDSVFSMRLQRSIAEGAAFATSNIFIHEIPADYQVLLEQEGQSFNDFVVSTLKLRFKTRNIFGPIKFDEVIAQGTSSGSFLDHNPDLFPNAKRSFFHILWQPETGVLIPSDLEPSKSFDVIKRAFPDIEHVALLHFVDPTKDLASDPIVRAFTAAWNNQYRNQVTFDAINLYEDEQQIIDQANALPAKTALIYLYFRDGRPIRPRFDSWIHEQSTMPVFGLFEDSLDGFVGGAVISSDRLAEAIIARAEENLIPDTTDRITQLTYNYPELIKCGIDPEGLGAGVVIKGTPDNDIPREWVAYIVAFTAVIIAMLIGVLLIQQRKSLEEAKAFARTMSEATKRQAHLLHQLHVTREHSAIGEMHWTRQTGSLSIDAVAARLFGLDDGSWVYDTLKDIPNWRELIHKDDIALVDDFFYCVSAGLKAKQLDFRLKSANDDQRILRILGADTRHDDDGQEVGVHGLVIDISDSSHTRRHLEAEVRTLRDHAKDALAAARLSEKALDLGKMGQIQIDCSTDQIKANKRACEVLSLPFLPSDSIPGLDLLFSRVHASDLDLVFKRIKDAKSGSDVDTFRFRVRPEQNAEYVVGGAVTAYFEGSDQPVKLTIVVCEIPEIPLSQHA